MTAAMQELHSKEQVNNVEKKKSLKPFKNEDDDFLV